MDRTIEIMAGQDTAPTETPAGGTLSTDFSEQLILLGNRLSALETSINRLSKLIEPEQDNTTEPEQDSPENTTEPEQDRPDDNTEAEPESPAESEEINNERKAD